MPLVSCLLPTFNRLGSPVEYMVNEAVECFLRQTHKEKELIICNDCPEQKIIYDHPRVKVINTNERFPSLSDKIDFMIGQSQGEILYRQDDDDISLPNRIEYSLKQLGDNLEWRPIGAWFYDGNYKLDHGGNGHPMGVFRREVLKLFPEGRYPKGLSGIEDQAFNGIVEALKVSTRSEVAPEDRFYIYRFGVSPCHLSGKGGGTSQNPHQPHYDAIGERSVTPGTYTLKPYWKENYIARVAQQLRRSRHQMSIGGAFRDPQSVGNYFNFSAFYDWLSITLPRNCRFVEVGSMYGASICYLANKLRDLKKAPHLIAVDLGVGVDPNLFNPVSRDLGDIGILARNITELGCQDLVSILATESTRAASLFPDGSLDGVMLDDAHDRQSVRANLQAWWPKLKPNAIFCGHDYMGCSHPEVKPTVDEFFKVPTYMSLASVQTPTVWIKRKT